jgi:integrase
VPVSGELVFTAPKTEEGRRLIPLDDETVRIIREHRERQLLERSYMGDGYEDGDLVFCHADGRPFDPRGVSLRFVRLAKAAGLPTIRLHDLRHGVATMGLGAEVHAEVIRRRLGHRVSSVVAMHFVTTRAASTKRPSVFMRVPPPNAR